MSGFDYRYTKDFLVSLQDHIIAIDKTPYLVESVEECTSFCILKLTNLDFTFTIYKVVMHSPFYANVNIKAYI